MADVQIAGEGKKVRKRECVREVGKEEKVKRVVGCGENQRLSR